MTFVSFTPGGPVTCTEHGVLTPPGGNETARRMVVGAAAVLGVRFEGDAADRLTAGITMLLHLRDAHGKDVDGAIRKVLEEVKRQATGG